MKKITLSLLIILIAGTISNVSYATTFDAQEEVENKIQQELEKVSNEGTSFENVEIDFENEEIKIEAEVENDGETHNVEITNDFSEEQAVATDSLTVKEASNGEENEYSIYFGTVEEKHQLEQAMAEEERLLQDIEDGKYTDEELEKIELPTEKIFNNKQNQITTAEELAETPIVMTDLATNSEREIDPSDGVASYAWAIPVGIYITRQVATQLLKMAFAAVIGGLLGAALTLISVNVNYRKYYEHYRVVRTGKVGLVVLGGMNLNTAVNYLKIRGDVWSISQPLAWRVAYFAGTPRGGKLQQPTKAERHGGPGNFYHHHTWNRAGGHSFYGTAR